MNKTWLTLIFIIVLSNVSLSQERILNEDKGLVSVNHSINHLPSDLLLKEHFNIEDAHTLVPLHVREDQLNHVHASFKQTYKGYTVENHIVKLHREPSGKARISGTLMDIQDISLRVSISESAARKIAEASLNNRSFYPPEQLNKAELVIYQSISEKNLPALCYKIDVYGLYPLKRADIYVHAQTGRIMGHNDKIHHTQVPSSGMSYFNGEVDFISTKKEGKYYLESEKSGTKIKTSDLRQSQDYSTAEAISSQTKYFGEDAIGVQVQWGIESVFDYFMEKHSHNSYDNQGSDINAYVHYGTEFNNAFWDGTRLTFGDGDKITYDAVASLDIVAHEFSHGIIQYSSNLVYAYESGALNESFADIFAEAVEFYVTGEVDWEIGRDIYMKKHRALRSLKDPIRYSNPDTYFGDYWLATSADHGGVHINSGVQNKWFYLLSEGGHDINDNNETYFVEGIGIEKAAAIAYRNLTSYMFPTASYNHAHRGAIQAAIDLYGEGSPEHISTKNAWHAVGIGKAYESSPCYQDSLTISIEFDNYPDETSWILKQGDDTILVSPSYENETKRTIIEHTYFLEDGNFRFVISDEYGDGVCCSYGNGRFKLSSGDKYIYQGGYFSLSDSVDFCIGANIDTLPPLVSNLEVVDIDVFSATAAWSSATDEDSIILYEVSLNQEVVKVTTDTSYTFSELEDNSTYNVQVIAIDQGGNISDTLEADFTTLEFIDDIPPSAPTNLVVKDITTITALATWGKSEDNSGSVSYFVKVANLGYRTMTPAQVLVNLKPDSVYTVSVKAIDPSGNESPWTRSTFKTLPEIDTEAPSEVSNIKINSLGENQAAISWDASTDNKGVIGYEVFLDSEFQGLTQDLEFLFSDLVPGTNYATYVVAVDEAENRSTYEALHFTTTSIISEEEDSILILGSYFEEGWDGWNDGGIDCYRYTGGRAYEGEYAIRLRDNSGEVSSMYTDPLVLSPYAQVDLNFMYQPYSMEYGERFFIEYNDGKEWHILSELVSGKNFNNAEMYEAKVSILSEEYELTDQSRFRIRCDASSNGDNIYVDAVNIIGWQQENYAIKNNNDTDNLVDEDNESETFSFIPEVSFYPNPVSDILKIWADGDIEKVDVITIDGQTIFTSVDSDISEIDMSTMTPGLYVVAIKVDGKITRHRISKL